jgi:hypothetical protein
MGDGGRQINMSHSITPNFGLDDFNTAFFTDDAPVFHSFIFAAIAFVILGGPEYLCTEKAIPFRLEGPIVYGFRLFNLSM